MKDIMPVVGSSKKNTSLFYAGAILGAIVFFFAGAAPLAVVGLFVIAMLITVALPFLNFISPLTMGGVMATAAMYLFWVLANGGFAGSL